MRFKSASATSNRAATTATAVVYVTLASSSVAYAAWRLLQWRARKRVRKTVERVENLLLEGPLIDYNDPQLRQRILTAAIKRASKWISLSQAKEMAGQVGGVSIHKRPILSLRPDYVLKPLQTDHRGIRELAFYEALHMASKSFRATKNPTTGSSHGGSFRSTNSLAGMGNNNKGGSGSTSSAKSNQKNAYAMFLTGRDAKGIGGSEEEKNGQRGMIHYCGEVLDMLAVAAAMAWNDPVVTGSEEDLKQAWRNVQREVDALAKLTKFTAPYYGLVGQRRPSPEAPLGVSGDAHLLLHDLTNNFVKPCVIDLKIGTQTYEPDAPAKKRQREINKYPQQEEFGFRVVGMRFYEPGSPEADENGYLFFRKEYGRSLRTREDLLEALRRFFGAGCEQQQTASASTTNNGDKKPNQKRASPLRTRNNRCPLRTKSIANLMVEMRSLRRWFDDNGSTLRFYASSLLIVYEGDTSGSSSSSPPSSSSPSPAIEDSGLVSLKMIDFGRVRRRRPPSSSNSGDDSSTVTRDEGYRRGLRTLHHLFSDLLEEEELKQEGSQHTPPRTPPRRQGSADYIV